MDTPTPRASASGPARRGVLRAAAAAALAGPALTALGGTGAQRPPGRCPGGRWCGCDLM
ncbi:hypothetical protein ACWD5R_19350 [Streptomyces sp. NPDC002514]|uniref:hypothetical protein n=1 Tax=unclassified Streptomyces TaxID=2593676 RepID=UPI0036B6BF2F